MKKAILFSTIAILLSLSACTMDDKLNLCVTQEENIEKYINQNFPDATVYVTDTGISRIVMIDGKGTPAQKGDSVVFSYAGFTFNNGPSTQFASGIAKAKLGDKSLITGLDEGITGMMQEEEAYIAFSARYGFFDEAIAALPTMTPLIYYVKLEYAYR